MDFEEGIAYPQGIRRITGVSDMSRRKLFDYDKEDIRRLYFDEGIGVVSIGKIYGVDTKKVWSFINEFLGGCRHNVPFLLKYKEDVRRLYFDERISAASIGKMYGLSGTGVARFINKSLGGCRQTKGSLLLKYKEDIRRLYFDEGLSSPEIGILYGFSKKAIARFINMHLGGCRTFSEATKQRLQRKKQTDQTPVPTEQEEELSPDLDDWDEDAIDQRLKKTGRYIIEE